MPHDTTKRCRLCGKVKPRDAFHTRPGSLDGLRNNCKQCKAERDAARRRVNAAIPTPCAVCGALFPYKELTKHTHKCAICAQETKRVSRAAYKQRPEVKHRGREWMQQKRAANRDTTRQQTRDSMRRFRERNPEQARQTQRRWRERNIDRVRQLYQQWRQTPHARDVRRALHQKRRSQLQQAAGSFTAAEWQALKQQYDYHCLRCHRREPEIVLTADHVVPLVRGGSNFISNIQPLCSSCNSSKNANTIDFRPLWSQSFSQLPLPLPES